MKNAFHYILVAEDDEDDRHLFSRHFLEIMPNASVKFCKDGKDILSFLNKCPGYQLPIVLLLDYKMPVVNGNEVLKSISTDARYHSIRKFVWSTANTAEHIDECLACGAERFFKKPVSIAEAAEIIGLIGQAYQSALVS